MSKEAVGKKLLHYRSLKGLSQKQLAKLAGVASNTVQAVEYGKGASLKTLLKLSRALNIGIEQLDDTAALPVNKEPGSPDPVLNQISKLTQQIEALRAQIGTSQDTIVSKSPRARPQETQPQLSDRDRALLEAFQSADEETRQTIEIGLGLREYHPEIETASQETSKHKNKA